MKERRVVYLNKNIPVPVFIERVRIQDFILRYIAITIHILGSQAPRTGTAAAGTCTDISCMSG